jgi:hypothetical protein
VQTLQDAEALLLLEKNFEAMFSSMPGDEVLAELKKQLAGVSERAQLAALDMGWPALARKVGAGGSCAAGWPALPRGGRRLAGAKGRPLVLQSIPLAR